MNPFDLFSPHVCNVCIFFDLQEGKIRKQQKGRRCEGCQLIIYCGTKHQQLDWPIHKDFCRAASKIMRKYKVGHPFLITGQISNQAKLETVTLQVKYLFRLLLQRKLDFHEEELTSFPRHCAICFTFENVLSCKNCRAVAYCSDEHEKEHMKIHKTECHTLAIAYCPYKSKMDCVSIEKLSLFDDDLRNSTLIDALQRISNKLLPSNPTVSSYNYSLYSEAADYSCVGTLAYAMQFFKFGKDSLTVFIVGATVERRLWFQLKHLRFLTFIRPGIFEYYFYFIGIEVDMKDAELITYESYKFNLNSYRMPIEEVLQESKKLYPDIFLIYNCGFSEFSRSKVPPQNDVGQKVLQQMLKDESQNNAVQGTLDVAKDKKKQQETAINDAAQSEVDEPQQSDDKTTLALKTDDMQNVTDLPGNKFKYNEQKYFQNLKMEQLTGNTQNAGEQQHLQSIADKCEKLEASLNFDLKTGNDRELGILNAWSQGILSLAESFNTPIIFTSFTNMEAEFDLHAFKKYSALSPLSIYMERLITIHKNPFHDLRPLRSWHHLDKENIFYRNNYIQGIITKSL